MRVALLMVCVAVLGARCARADEPEVSLPQFTIDEATTRFLGPLRKDGTIDYVAAVNEYFSKGVTRENNAAVPLLEAVSAANGNQVRHYARVRAALGMKVVAERPLDEKGEPGLNQAQVGAAQEGPWVAASAPELAKWLAENEGRLGRVVEASRRERFYLPLVRAEADDLMVSVLLPHVSEVRQLAELLRARAMLRLGGGDAAGFRADALAVVRLGRLVTQAPTVVEKLVGYGVEMRGLQALQLAATGGWLSAEQAAAALADLDGTVAAGPMHEAFDTGERSFVLEFLQVASVRGAAGAGQMLVRVVPDGQFGMLAVPSPADLGKDWDAALRRVNGWYDRMVEAGKRADHADRQRALAELNRDLAKLKGEGIGAAAMRLEDRLLTLAAPAFERVYARETGVRAVRTVTRVVLALAAYRATEGKYPGELKELAPGYLKGVRADPFTGEGLVYRIEAGGYEVGSTGDGTLGSGMEGLVVKAKK